MDIEQTLNLEVAKVKTGYDSDISEEPGTIEEISDLIEAVRAPFGYQVATEYDGSDLTPTDGEKIGKPITFLRIDGVDRFRIFTRAFGWSEFAPSGTVLGDGSPILAIDIPNDTVHARCHVFGGVWLPTVVTSLTHIGCMVAIDGLNLVHG